MSIQREVINGTIRFDGATRLEDGTLVLCHFDGSVVLDHVKLTNAQTQDLDGSPFVIEMEFTKETEPRTYDYPGSVSFGYPVAHLVRAKSHAADSLWFTEDGVRVTTIELPPAMCEHLLQRVLDEDGFMDDELALDEADAAYDC